MHVPFDPLCWLPLVLDGSGCRRPWPWGSSIQISSKVGPPSPSHKIVHQSSGLLCGIRGTIAHKPYRDTRPEKPGGVDVFWAERMTTPNAPLLHYTLLPGLAQHGASVSRSTSRSSVRTRACWGSCRAPENA